MNPACAFYLNSYTQCLHLDGDNITVLLEHFTGEKPLRMSQISRNFDPLLSTVLARIVCIY